MSAEEARLLRRYRGLDAASRRSLLDFAEFLSRRAAPGQEPGASAPLPRPAVEAVPHAIRRLNHSYPGLARHKLMPRVEKLLAQHMVDGRPAQDVIDELEALFAAEFRQTAGD